MKWRWLAVLMPAILGLASVLLLVRARVIDFSISLPADFDVIIILSGLGISTFTLINLALREGMERIRQQSVENARSEALAEHRRFLQRLDHEFKNPLTAIRAGLVNLSETLHTDEQKQIVTSIENQALRLNNLVTGLRKLAELETLPLELGIVDVSDLLQEAITLVQDRPELQTRQLLLNLSSHPLPTITGDRDLLLLAVHNLLDNALKFTRPGDSITLQAQTNEETLTIRVIDTGLGIPEAEIPLVWEELYRGQRANGTMGSGIGLALVEAILLRHAGNVSITSRVGQGTEVTLWLPLSK